MNGYSIKDLEKISGVKSHTIRIWEQRYALLNPERTDTNIRRYTDEDLKKLLKVALLNKYGTKISKIVGLTEEEIALKVNECASLSDDKRPIIEQLVIAMVELDETKFQEVINGEIRKSSFEETIESVIYPFFERIGVLWITGHVHPGQEHFMSNLIRQKIISQIDQLDPRTSEESKHIVAFLPEGEYHELGLLYYSYHLKRLGHKLTYLGQSTPFDDVVKVVERQSPDYILCSFVQEIPEKEINEFCLNLLNHSDKTTVLISGFQASKVSINEGKLHLLKSVNDLISIFF